MIPFFDLYCSYANRAKNIQNHPHINDDPRDSLLQKLEDELILLKRKLDESKQHRYRRPMLNESNNKTNEIDTDDEELYRKELQDRLNEEKRLIHEKKACNGKIFSLIL